MAKSRAPAIAEECKRQSESCLFTSTAFFEYAKYLRDVRRWTVIIPLTLGSLASFSILANSTDPTIRVVTALCSFVAGLIPSLRAALKADENLDACCLYANEFKNLQDRFRTAAQIDALKGTTELERTFNQLREQIEALRKASGNTPEWAFKKAQSKIKEGDYDFQIDIDALARADENGSKPPIT